jgi:hypothetical protein
MLQAHSTLRALSRNFFKRAVLAAAIAPALLSVGNAAGAEKAKNDRASRLLETIRIPPTKTNNTAGGLYSFDISWVDQATRTYYFADRSNAVVNIVDTTSDTLIAQLTPAPLAPFAGISPPAFSTAVAGPDGVTVSGHCLFVTDAPSRVVSFDTTFFPPKPVNDVKTDPSSAFRADELAVDPKDSLILAINNQDTPPFGTFIKFDATTCKLTQPASPGADRVTFTTATNGAEQPIWDPVTQKFYLSIPQIGPALESGAVVRIDAITKKVDNTFGVMFCQPGGLSKGPNNDALIGCSIVFDTAGGQWSGAADANTAAPIQVILDLKTGAQDQVAGPGASDEVWYNSGDGNYYTASQRSPLGAVNNGGQTQVASSASILGVIDAKDEEVLQLVPTYSVLGVAGIHPAGSAHSVAADAKNNHIFVPLAANNVFPNCLVGCIAVYAHGDEDEAGQAALP